MAPEIVGTLPVNHFVDHNGSFSINVPLQVPHAKIMPQLSLVYHSASNTPSTVGLGWALKGASLIERVPTTIDQDGRSGVVNYDENDCFALDGQRLIQIGHSTTETEYRFEIESWSRIVAYGDPVNPTSWEERLPNGTKRKFGDTQDSNIKAQGGTATRVWAISKHEDAFTNSISFKYTNDAVNGSFYLSEITYGGNDHLAMAHQRKVSLGYETRLDKRITYLGGYKICIDKRLAFVESSVHDKVNHKHILVYDTNPATQASRLKTVTLVDAFGAMLRPLKFDWTSGPEKVFDPVPGTTNIKTVSSFDILPMDVTASGKSDIVIASSRYDSKRKMENALHLAVHLADGNGKVHEDPTPGSGFTGLRYPDQILPLDITGDGKTDLLHIAQVEQRYYNLSILISTGDGYQPQQALRFVPEFFGGDFYSGDFTGDGRVGLVYVYEIGSRSTLRFVQFKTQITSNGFQFNPLNPRDGPKGFSLSLTHVVVGDLNGNGTEDIILISKKPRVGGDVCDIRLAKSVDGTLQYDDAEQPLKGSGDSVPWLPSTTFHPYAADGDGKASILAVSKSAKATLQWQLLRSTGPSLLPQSDKPTITDIPYLDQEVSMGCVTLAKILSTFTVELVTTYKAPSGFKVHILRFDGDKFTPITGLENSPVTTATALRWADLRGVGRTDYTLHAFDSVSSTLRINFMTSSLASQPVDFISGYENGLGAKIKARYASLSDSSVYSTTDDNLTATTAAVNAMAQNVSSSMSLSSSPEASSASQSIGHSRTQLVHFPAFVVEEISSAAQPGVVDPELQNYTYKDAQLNFDGRGWLGFKSVTKSLQPAGSSETTIYSQTFPFLGQANQVTTMEFGGHKLLEKVYDWRTVSPIPDHPTIPDHPKIQSVLLWSLKESHYEAGDKSFDVDVTYQHDDYANVTQVAIKSSQPGVPLLTIDSKFDDPAPSNSRIIGNKTREWVTQQSGETTSVLKDTEYVYVPGTTVSKEVSNWVADSTWVTQTFEFDDAGNEKVIKGPGPSRRELTYDETHSHVVLLTSFSDDTNSLKETASYDLALGKPLVVTDANGHSVSRSYDVLGRIEEISEGETTPLLPIETRSFHYDEGQFYQIRKVSARRDANDNQWTTTKAYVDGLERAWKVETSRPDDLTAMITSEVHYDGAGRIVAYSRDHLATSTPTFNTYKYNARSQVIEQISPPAATSVSPITTTYDYKFESGKGKVIEVRSDGGATPENVTRELLYLPNSQPSPDKFVKPIVTRLTNELGYDIQTQFDGLGRPIFVEDPSGVELSLSWDGLSRQTERRLSQPGATGKGSEDISHFLLQYDDTFCTNTVINKLTNSTVVTKSDYLQRPISKTSTDQVTAFTYDRGGTYSKGRIVEVISKTGGQEQYRQHFDYDIKGNLTQGRLSLDGHDYVTSHEWTPGGALSKTTNPDGSIATRSFLLDGETVHKLELFGAAKTTSSASVTFDDYDNSYLRPLVTEYGNGIKLSSTIAPSGALTSTSVSHGNDTLLQQGWTIDAFTRIRKYEVGRADDMDSSFFDYDPAGQLKNHSPNSLQTTSEPAFTYDHSGNLSTKDGKIFTNVGWQLTAIKDQHDVTECTFKYSKDGNLEKKVVNGTTTVMKYNAEGQLVDLDGTTFLYDYGGRMIKSAVPNGEVTIYPSETYEVSTSVSGKKSHTAYLYHGFRRASLTKTEEPLGEPTSTNVYYFLNDHLGSTIAASDNTGKIVTRYKYEPFGKVVVDGDLDVARYKYQGKQQFGSLYYFGARFYDPDTARFLTLDDYPTSLYEISPATLNMYTFSRNDPINFIDLNGNAPWWHWLVDFVLIAAGAALTVAGFNIIGSPLLGAGISGLTYDLSHSGKTSDSDWGIQIGIGAAFGFAGGAIGAGIDGVLPTVSSAEMAAARVVGGFVGRTPVVTGGFVARTALRVALTVASDSSLSVLQQVADNAIAGRPLNSDLGTAAWQGIAFGSTPVMGGDESLSLVRKVSKYGKWNTAGKLIQAGEKTLGPKLGRGISILQYPLRHSEGLKFRGRPSSSFTATVKSLANAVPSAATEIGSNLDPSKINKFLHAQNIPGL